MIMRDIDYDRLHTERHEALMGSIKSVHTRLDLLNGRTRNAERDIAILSDRSWRVNAISLSSISIVIAAALYWLTHP